MRYYKFQLEGAPNVGWSTQLASGGYDWAAPLFELDISIGAADQHGTLGNVTIWGISIDTIKQSKNFFNKKFSLSAGMSPSLPLATAQASQRGQLCSGAIAATYSQWQGTDQNIGFTLTGSPGSPQTPPPFSNNNTVPPRNLVLNWRKGAPLGHALQNALQTAFPGMKAVINVSPSLIAPQDNIHFSDTLASFSAAIRELSKAILSPNMPGYPGVSIVLNNGQVSAHDGTQNTTAKTLNFTDFIGQPSWIGPNLISAKVVMRGDLAVGNDITLPTDTILNVSGGGLQGQDLTFSGTWKIASLRHVGNSRAPDGNAWCTIVEAYNNTPGSASSSPATTQNEGGTGSQQAPVLA